MAATSISTAMAKSPVRNLQLATFRFGVGVAAQQQAWRARNPICNNHARLPALLLRRCSSFLVLFARGSLLQSCIRLKNLTPMRKNVVASTLRMARVADSATGESVPEQTVMALPTRFDNRQQLQYGQQCRSFLLPCGAGAQDVCAITLFESPWRWPLYPCVLSVRLSSHGQRCSQQIRCSSYSSVWQRSSPTANASVDSDKAQTIEQLWEEYCADPSQWWDNRVDKRSPRSPDFRHKLTRKALWVDGWSTPAWVKARLESMAQGRLQLHVDYGTRDSQDIAQENRSRNRLHKGNNEKGITIAREKRKYVQGGSGSVHMLSASTTSEAVAVLKKRLQQGIPIDSYMYVQVLKQCLKEKDLTAAKQVHDCVTQSGMEQNIFVANNLLIVYIGCGRLLDARRMFDELVKKDVISWNVMIGGYAQQNCAKDAMEIFNQMRQEGVQPNEITYLSILKACASPSALNWGKELHEHIRHGGLQSDVRVGTALLQMYAECGCIEESRQAFDSMEERNVITWTAMIGAYAKSGCGVEGYQLFLQMKRDGYKPNEFTYTSLLNAPASAGALEWVKEVHRHARDGGIETNLRVGNALVHMYSKSGCIDDARLVFDRMAKRDVITWTALIGGLAQHGCGHQAYQLFLQMEQEGLKPNAITYTSILNASASAGALEWVKEVHRHASKAGFDSDLRVGSALVHMYAKSGSIDDARLVFDKMENRDVVTWTAMMVGLAQHGCGHEALEIFQKMNAEGVKPSETSFVAVLSACSHAGLVDEGRRLFLAMTKEYGIEPTVVHCNCMVDLLGRAGHLEEAKLFISNMPVEPDEPTWGALLGACRTHANVELGELAAKERVKLLPKDASTYVLLSNIYTAAGKWEEVASVRTMMQEKGIRKQPGRSWIVVDNKVHEFVVGDKSHPEAKEIYAELNRLTENIKAAGYIPDTRLVLKNVDEEDKELALCSHSEKLAIVYGLLWITPGEPIFVYKNLRVCSDCHAATKLISKVTGREIVVRDAIRFHHFKDGKCSCDDYW